MRSQTDIILDFIRPHKQAVIATVSSENHPEAAIVGIAINNTLDIIFDTLNTTRKYTNLLKNTRVAVVIGNNDEEITVQYEGIASEIITPADLATYKKVYFKTFPDGTEREAWKGITYFVIKPLWIRYSDFSNKEPIIFELNF